MRYKLRYHHSENQDTPRNLYKIAWGRFMEIWLQKPMTNTSLINVETLTPKGVPGDIFKLRRAAEMLLVSQAKTRHVQNFWRSYPLEVSAISNRTVTIHSWLGETCPSSPLLWCWPHFREFPVLFPKISPCPSNLPSKQKAALLSLLSATYLHVFVFTPMYLSS